MVRDQEAGIVRSFGDHEAGWGGTFREQAGLGSGIVRGRGGGRRSAGVHLDLFCNADWGETWGLDLGARPNICLQTGPAQGGGDLGLLGHLRGRGREGSAGKADDLGRRGLLALDVPVLGFPELGRRGRVGAG